MNFNDYAASLKARDTIHSIVRTVVEAERPRYRYAVVTSIDDVNNKADVLFSGESESHTVSMGALRPTEPNQMVRVEGYPGDRYISDVYGASNIPVLDDPPEVPEPSDTVSDLLFGVAGDAGDFDTYSRGNHIHGLLTLQEQLVFPYVCVTRTATQNITSGGSGAKIQLNVVEDDELGWWDSGNYELVIQLTGIYTISYGLLFDSVISAGSSPRRAWIYKNGSACILHDEKENWDNTQRAMLGQCRLKRLVAGTTLQLWAYHGFSPNLDTIQHEEYTSHLAVQYMGKLSTD